MSQSPLEKLDEIVRNCSVKNWDSYNSDPVKAGAVAQARNFLEFEAQKELSWRKHNVYPTCVGNIGVEWREGDTECCLIFGEDTLSVELNNDHRCMF